MTSFNGTAAQEPFTNEKKKEYEMIHKIVESKFNEMENTTGLPLKKTFIDAATHTNEQKLRDKIYLRMIDRHSYVYNSKDELYNQIAAEVVNELTDDYKQINRRSIAATKMLSKLDPRTWNSKSERSEEVSSGGKKRSRKLHKRKSRKSRKSKRSLRKKHRKRH